MAVKMIVVMCIVLFKCVFRGHCGSFLRETRSFDCRIFVHDFGSHPKGHIHRAEWSVVVLFIKLDLSDQGSNPFGYDILINHPTILFLSWSARWLSWSGNHSINCGNPVGIHQLLRCNIKITSHYVWQAQAFYGTTRHHEHRSVLGAAMFRLIKVHSTISNLFLDDSESYAQHIGGAMSMFGLTQVMLHDDLPTPRPYTDAEHSAVRFIIVFTFTIV